MIPTASSDSAPSTRAATHGTRPARTRTASVAIAAAARLARTGGRRIGAARPGCLPLEVRALEVVGEPVALELAGPLLGERVERHLAERELLCPVRAPDDAERRAELRRRRLRLRRRGRQRLPERRARADAVDLAAALGA